jgi:hypothetical protein
VSRYRVCVIAGAPPISEEVEISGVDWAVREAVARVVDVNRRVVKLCDKKLLCMRELGHEGECDA